ncbi:MAG: hypothetical protein H0V82_04595 [Candidatus Protochlamydia sp.]|nr:hypothetical protein [Candidatus Protochlamydia sp.]
MVNPIEPIAHNPVETPEPTFGQQVCNDLIIGAARGVIWCGVEKLAVWLESVQVEIPISLPSYVFVQFSATAFVQTAKVTHHLFMKCLGDREVYENMERTELYSDSLRKHIWAVISVAQHVEQKTDALFSHVLGIRTCKELKEQGLSDNDLDFLEILRQETKAQAQLTITEVVSLSLALPFGAHLGFHIATGNSIIWLNAMNFFIGTITRVSNIYTKRMEEEMLEEARIAALQNPPIQN